MKSLLVHIFTLHLASAATHSLDYFFTGVTPGTCFPEFTAVGQLDGLQGGYYDSISREVILTGEWIKNNTDEEHWKEVTQRSHRYQEDFKFSLATAMKHFSHTEGIHTWQWMCGCELHDDGTKTAYSQYGYDGEDFLSLDQNTITWTAANDKVVIIKTEWGTPKARNHKIFLEKTCIEWLQKYVNYGRDTLERKVSPEVSLFQKDSSSPVVCHATGFFPKALNISWQKNGEDSNEDVELRETLPNQDGTFQKRSILTVSPEELKMNKYACIIQHSSLEILVIPVQTMIRPKVSGGDFIGISTGALVTVLLIIIGVGVLVWMKKKPGKEENKQCPDTLLTPAQGPEPLEGDCKQR